VSIADAIVGGTHDPTLLECINAAKEFDHVGAPPLSSSSSLRIVGRAATTSRWR
jgi:hypothetical protein